MVEISRVPPRVCHVQSRMHILACWRNNNNNRRHVALLHKKLRLWEAYAWVTSEGILYYRNKKAYPTRMMWNYCKYETFMDSCNFPRISWILEILLGVSVSIFSRKYFENFLDYTINSSNIPTGLSWKFENDSGVLLKKR